MSKRSSQRRKSVRSTIRSSRDHGRAVAPHASTPELLVTRAYPSAAELFATGTAWRSYVSETLRSLLAPAALAGAVGLAGCAGLGDTPGGVVTGDTTTTESSATLTPIGQPVITSPPPNGGGDVVLTPIPSVTLTPLPPGTRVITAPLPPHFPVPPGYPSIHPASNPPMVRGESVAVMPDVNPPQIDGGPHQIEPIPPTVPTLHVRPQPPPNPHPPAVPGGMRLMLPSDDVSASS